MENTYNLKSSQCTRRKAVSLYLSFHCSPPTLSWGVKCIKCIVTWRHLPISPHLRSPRTTWATDNSSLWKSTVHRVLWYHFLCVSGPAFPFSCPSQACCSSSYAFTDEQTVPCPSLGPFPTVFVASLMFSEGRDWRTYPNSAKYQVHNRAIHSNRSILRRVTHPKLGRWWWRQAFPEQLWLTWSILKKQRPHTLK